MSACLYDRGVCGVRDDAGGFGALPRRVVFDTCDVCGWCSGLGGCGGHSTGWQGQGAFLDVRISAGVCASVCCVLCVVLVRVSE